MCVFSRRCNRASSRAPPSREAARKVVNCTDRRRYSAMQLHHLTTENQLCVTVTEGCQEAFSNGGVIWLTDRCCATINGAGARCCSE